MSKLTLSVDARVVARAKRYARANGTSVSRLVERMLDVAAAPASMTSGASGDTGGDGVPPVLGTWRGSLKRGTVRDYHRYLAQKYR